MPPPSLGCRSQRRKDYFKSLWKCLRLKSEGRRRRKSIEQSKQMTTTTEPGLGASEDERPVSPPREEDDHEDTPMEEDEAVEEGQSVAAVLKLVNNNNNSGEDEDSKSKVSKSGKRRISRIGIRVMCCCCPIHCQIRSLSNHRALKGPPPKPKPNAKCDDHNSNCCRSMASINITAAYRLLLLPLFKWQ